MRGGISEQAQQLCNAFDSALTKNCTALMPGEEIPNDQNRAAVHARLFEKWKSANPPPLFSRIAVLLRTPDDFEFFELNQSNGELTRRPWPPEWNFLRRKLATRMGHGSPSQEDPDGSILEFPVFGAPPDGQNNPPPDDGNPPPEGGRRGENEWVILELDTNYLCHTWLPELTGKYLKLNDRTAYDIVVKTILPPRSVVYSSSSEALNNSETPVTLRFNRQGRDPDNLRGPPPDFRWSLEVRPHPGALESIVSASRRRNLAVAILLNALILAAGLALVRLTRRSRQLAEAQMNFVANVSHELRTPLTVIRGAAHNLKRGVVKQSDQIEKYSDLIMQHAEQLGEMVEQVLQLAGVKKNQSAAVRQPVELAGVLNEAVAATAHDTQAAQCKVELEIPPSLPAVAGDAAALRRVFQNLITNAAKHGGFGGWIGITAVSMEDGGKPGVEIHVADRGPGIPRSELSRIFQPFFRGAAAQAKQIRGSGLGLNLVREIVEAHGGNISVRSETGHGAVFIVRLPAATTDGSK